LMSLFTSLVLFLFSFLTATATTEIYTLSLHDALPISFSDPAWIFERKLDGVRCATFRLGGQVAQRAAPSQQRVKALLARRRWGRDRKSTRLNSSHDQISYAVFCLKKKKKLIVKR